MADEFRTKQLLTDALNVYKILQAKDYDRVRFVTQAMGSKNSNWGNYKPLIVIGYSLKDGEDRYVLFSSKFYTDSLGRKTTLYSSIRIGWFDDDGVKTIKYPNLQSFEEAV